MIANNITFISHVTLPYFSSITHNVASADHGWNLILVNNSNYIPDDYEVELTELLNGEKVDSRIYPELQEMFNAARAERYGLFVAAGYRIQEKQQQLLDEKIVAYENEGYSKSEAERLAKQWVAVPGTSERPLLSRLFSFMVSAPFLVGKSLDMTCFHHNTYKAHLH